MKKRIVKQVIGFGLAAFVFTGTCAGHVQLVTADESVDVISERYVGILPFDLPSLLEG